MPSVYVSPKHHQFLEEIVRRKIRGSKAEVVRDAISAYIPRLQKELNFWDDLQEERKSITEEEENEEDE